MTVNLDEIKLAPEAQELVDSLDRAAERLRSQVQSQPPKRIPFWLRNIPMFYGVCAGLGLIIGIILLEITK